MSTGRSRARRRACTVCAARAPKELLKPVRRTSVKRPGKPKGKYHKIPALQLHALHLLHWERRVSLNELGRRYWERFGYSSPSSCANSLSKSFRELGLPTHDRIEMTVAASYRHGMKRRKGSNSAAYKRFRAGEKGEQYDAPCTALTTSGKPCRVRALIGKTTCQFHDPDQRDRWVAMTAAMRTRSPLQDPARLEPVGPLQTELRAFFDWDGSWTRLAAATGISGGYLSKLSRSKQLQNIARDRAQLLRAAIAALTAPVPLDLHVSDELERRAA